MSIRIPVYMGQNLPIPTHSYVGVGFVHKVVMFDDLQGLSKIISSAQEEVYQMINSNFFLLKRGAAIINGEFRDTMKNGNPYIREFYGTIVIFKKLD